MEWLALIPNYEICSPFRVCRYLAWSGSLSFAVWPWEVSPYQRAGCSAILLLTMAGPAAAAASSLARQALVPSNPQLCDTQTHSTQTLISEQFESSESPASLARLDAWLDADRRRRSRQDLGHRFKSSNRQGRHRALRGPLASCAPVIGPLNTLSLGVCSPALSIVLAAKRRTELERLFRNAKVDGTLDAHRNHHHSRRWGAERTAQRDSPPESSTDQAVNESTSHLISHSPLSSGISLFSLPWSQLQFPSPRLLCETRLATDVAAVMVPFRLLASYQRPSRDPCRFFSKDALPGSLRRAVLARHLGKCLFLLIRS